MQVRQLVGNMAGQIVDLPYDVATSCLAVGTACLPGEEPRIRGMAIAAEAEAETPPSKEPPAPKPEGPEPVVDRAQSEGDSASLANGLGDDAGNGEGDAETGGGKTVAGPSAGTGEPVSALSVKHRGAGRYAVVDADGEIVESGLTKEAAEAIVAGNA